VPTALAIEPEEERAGALFRLEGALAPFVAIDVAAHVAASAPSIRKRVLGAAIAALGAGLAVRTPIADPREGARLAWRSLAGTSRDRLEVLALDFARDRVLPSVRPEARRLIDRAKKDGARLVLVSDGLDVVAREVANALGFDEVLANAMVFEDDGAGGEQATGELASPRVGPEIDTTRLAMLARGWGISLERSAAYGGLEGDAMLLGRVGRPCALAPDRGLCRIARDLDWPIVMPAPREESVR
jgi:HAD superfamily phosphoserine phosphatase-like hydrolase